MAYLTADEFSQTIRFLADDLGLQRLRDRLVRLNALVTRRRAASADVLADQLYLLTGGLRRQVPATFGVQGLWSEMVNKRVGEDGEKDLEGIADKINGCLGAKDEVEEGKESELDELVKQYETQLARAVGAERARIDMLMKAVDAVASRLRASPLVEVEAAADATPAADETTGGT